MDSAQIFKGQFRVCEYRFIIAAYSPNASFDAAKILAKKMRTTACPFSFYSFNTSDINGILVKYEYELTADPSDTGDTDNTCIVPSLVESKKITQTQFDVLN